MPVKLIALDLDRTLLDDDRQIPEANMDALRDAVDRGVAVALCSGRDLPSTLAIAEPMELSVWLVIQNGSLVINPAGEAIHTAPMSEGSTHRVLDVLEHHGLACVIYDLHPRAFDFWWQTGAQAPPGMLSFRTGHGARVTEVDNIRDVVTQPVSHVEAYDETERVLAAVEELSRDGEVIAIPTISASRKGNALLGIYAAGVSKEAALEHVIDELGITRGEVLAVGDNLNDVGMVRWAGIGVMVANGPEEALAAADWIAPSNNDAGVAAAVRRYV